MLRGGKGGAVKEKRNESAADTSHKRYGTTIKGFKWYSALPLAL